MFHARVEYEKISGAEPVVLTRHMEPYVAVQDLDGDGAGRAVGSDFPSCAYHDESQPKRSILRQCPGISPAALEQRWIVQASPFTSQMEAKNVPR